MPCSYFNLTYNVEDSQKEDYEKCFTSFKHAWELCQHELDDGTDINKFNVIIMCHYRTFV